jgi:preprotein translocase subunit SecG
MILAIVLVHIIVCLLLIAAILIQRGRGGGLVESFSGVESMFGTKTNVFLSRLTSILATLFLLTCLSLAVLAARQSRSLIRLQQAVKKPARKIYKQDSAKQKQIQGKSVSTPAEQTQIKEKAKQPGKEAAETQ